MKLRKDLAGKVQRLKSKKIQNNRNASIKGKKGGEGMVERDLRVCFLPPGEGERGRAGLSI